ncbi:hypothetical protein BCR39DRAFT_474891 [Naematelia encephala]|uniref:Uncharacterized protein n=1 Tax=Naematelia encephala TaxID=71784 RepID=A0A1Y2AEQ0_9TREE|nr:hypothetical protein BCR39DRAFT_474891 [Naematelia encephala]
MHQYQNEAQPHSQPQRWAPFTPYLPGSVAWYAGTFWRSEANHLSGPQVGGAPTHNLHLWTPLSSTATTYPHQPQMYQPQSYYTQQPPPYSSSSFSSSSPYTGGPSFGSGSRKGRNTMDFFTDMATESRKAMTIEKETREARDESALRYELNGKKVWKVGGVGMWSYSLDAREEEVKQRLWRDWGEQHGRDDWLLAARARTEEYNKPSRAVKPALMWKLVEKGQDLPRDALPIGNEADGMPLFSARAWWEGGLQLGKAGTHLSHRASISYGGSEHNLEVYEVLCGPPDPSLIKWMTYRHGEHAGIEGWQPVEGGREKDGTPVLLAKGEYENGVHPGKCLLNDDHACVGWGGGELWVRPFQILAYCSPSRR